MATIGQKIDDFEFEVCANNKMREAMEISRIPALLPTSS